MVLAAIAIAAGVWWVTAGNGGSPIWSAKPPPEVIELADRGLLTEEARQLWYDASPRVMSRSIDRECGSSGEGADGPEFYGCYLPGPVRGAGRIVVYDPPDDRLAGWTLTTAMHEMLHAAYDELSEGEQAEIDGLMAVELARLPADHPVRAQIERSVRGYEENRGTELFAYLGTQIELPGGFAPRVEEIFARYFTDRASVVGVYAQTEGVLANLVQSYRDNESALLAELQATLDAEAQCLADRAFHEAEVAQYNADADRYNALDPAERAQWSVTTTGTDGTSSTTSWETHLATRLDQLNALLADIQAREAALVAAKTATELRQSELEAQYRDVVALYEAAYPGIDMD